MSMIEKPIAEKRYLTFPEVWAAYGIGRKTIVKLVRERKLTRRMVGKAWRYPVADLEAVFSCFAPEVRRRRLTRGGTR